MRVRKLGGRGCGRVGRTADGAGRAARRCWALGRRGALRLQGHATGATLAGGARGARPAGRPGRGMGVLLGQQAVHSVHSACFDPISTQYCS